MVRTSVKLGAAANAGHLMDEELDEVVELRDTIYKAVQCCAGAEPAVAKALSAVSIHSQGKDCQAGV